MTMQRRTYVAPRVLSERIFEQAALACSTNPYPWDGSKFNGRDLPNLKTKPETCGYHHS